jgi:hypothetical protein
MGNVQHTAAHRTPTGRYSLRLGQQRRVRHPLQSGPGRVSKCYALDTRGGGLGGRRRTCRTWRSTITLFQPVPELDLELFDMPMGIARFNPMTGHVAWKRRLRAAHTPRSGAPDGRRSRCARKPLLTDKALFVRLAIEALLCHERVKPVQERLHPVFHGP